MEAERMRAMLLALPRVQETMQWGANPVFWVCDKKIGGKMFAIIDLDGKGGPVISYAAGAEHFAELVEREGILPAPYLARAHWVAVEDWQIFRAGDWKDELTAAYQLVYAKLPKRVRDTLELSPATGSKVTALRSARKSPERPGTAKA